MKILSVTKKSSFYSDKGLYIKSKSVKSINVEDCFTIRFNESEYYFEVIDVEYDSKHYKFTARELYSEKSNSLYHSLDNLADIYGMDLI